MIPHCPMCADKVDVNDPQTKIMHIIGRVKAFHERCFNVYIHECTLTIICNEEADA